MAVVIRGKYPNRRKCYKTSGNYFYQDLELVNSNVNSVTKSPQPITVEHPVDSDETAAEKSPVAVNEKNSGSMVPPPNAGRSCPVIICLNTPVVRESDSIRSSTENVVAINTPTTSVENVQSSSAQSSETGRERQTMMTHTGLLESDSTRPSSPLILDFASVTVDDQQHNRLSPNVVNLDMNRQVILQKDGVPLAIYHPPSKTVVMNRGVPCMMLPVNTFQSNPSTVAMHNPPSNQISLKNGVPTTITSSADDEPGTALSSKVHCNLRIDSVYSLKPKKSSPESVFESLFSPHVTETNTSNLSPNYSSIDEGQLKKSSKMREKLLGKQTDLYGDLNLVAGDATETQIQSGGCIKQALNDDLKMVVNNGSKTPKQLRRHSEDMNVHDYLNNEMADDDDNKTDQNNESVLCSATTKSYNSQNGVTAIITIDEDSERNYIPELIPVNRETRHKVPEILTLDEDTDSCNITKANGQNVNNSASSVNKQLNGRENVKAMKSVHSNTEKSEIKRKQVYTIVKNLGSDVGPRKITQTVEAQKKGTKYPLFTHTDKLVVQAESNQIRGWTFSCVSGKSDDGGGAEPETIAINEMGAAELTNQSTGDKVPKLLISKNGKLVKLCENESLQAKDGVTVEVESNQVHVRTSSGILGKSDNGGGADLDTRLINGVGATKLINQNACDKIPKLTITKNDALVKFCENAKDSITVNSERSSEKCGTGKSVSENSVETIIVADDEGEDHGRAMTSTRNADTQDSNVAPGIQSGQNPEKVETADDEATILKQSVLKTILEWLSKKDVLLTRFESARKLERALYKVNPGVRYHETQSDSLGNLEDFPCRPTYLLSNIKSRTRQSATALLIHHQGCPGKGCCKCRHIRAAYMHIVIFRHRCAIWHEFTKLLSIHAQFCKTANCRVCFCKFMKHELQMSGIELLPAHYKKDRNVLTKEFSLCKRTGSKHGGELRCCHDKRVRLPLLTNNEPQDLSAELRALEVMVSMFLPAESSRQDLRLTILETLHVAALEAYNIRTRKHYTDRLIRENITLRG